MKNLLATTFCAVTLWAAGTAWGRDCTSQCVTRCNDDISRCAQQCQKSGGKPTKSEMERGNACMSRCSEKVKSCLDSCTNRCH